MSTMQDVVDLARIDLNDSDKARYVDTDLLKHANAAIHEAYTMRPDLRLGSYATPVADVLIGDTFPLPSRYQRAVADYVIGRASSVDDEHVQSGRVTQYLSAFGQQIMGG